MQAEQGRKIGPVTGTFLVATTMIGSGIYMLPASAAAIGSISLVGWIIAAMGAVLVGLTLAGLARVEPGGSYLDSIAQLLGASAGLVATILYIFSLLLSLPMVAVAAAGYTGFIFPALGSPQAVQWVSIGYIWLIVAIAWGGAASIARIASLTLVVGMIPLVLVATSGWAHFDAEIFRGSWNISGKSNASAAMQATLLLFMAYLGLENASIVSDQMENPRRNVPIATIAGILFATIVYVASTTVISGLIPAATLAKSHAPFAEATAIILGSVAALLVAVCGATKAAGTLGALQLGSIESLLVLKRQCSGSGMSRTATNIAVGLIATAIALATASPDIASQFGLLATAMVTVCLFSYLLAGLALVKARGGALRLIGAAAILFILGLLAVQPLGDMLLPAILVVGAIPLAWLLLAWRNRAVSTPA